MPDTLPMQEGSPPRFSFPELLHPSDLHISACCSELSSNTSTPFVSAPSSPTRTIHAFYFSAPTSPSWPPRSHFPHSTTAPPSSSLQCSSNPPSPPPPPPHHHHDLALSDSSSQSIHSWARQTVHLHSQTEHHCNSSFGYSLSSSSSSQNPPQVSRHMRTSTWAPQPLHTEQQQSPSSYSPFTHVSYVTEDERSGRRWSSAQQNSLQKVLETEHARDPLVSHASPQIKDLYAAHSLKSIRTESANPKSLKRLQVEDVDASYSRKGFYASAVPFAWEEKPGTPKARSTTSEASYGEDDSPSNLLSGSSEFEFSARFSELEDPPMSPTPISSTFNSFKHHYGYGSPSPTYNYPYDANPDRRSETANEEQIWPLRPPPRLDNPRLQKEPIKDEGSELMHNQASLSVPQSPRSQRIFDLRGVLCGISSQVDAVFDPFLAAMEKSMAKNGEDEELGKSHKKKMNRSSHGHHRRAQSLSPLRVFHWDDHSAKSYSSSNGSSCMDEVKNKHPIQREINARHSAGTPKGSKRWSFKGFLHRKSVSGGESARNSNTSASLRSSGRESCSSSGMGEGPMDASSVDDSMKIRGANSPMHYNNPSMLASNMPSTPPSILSPSSSNSSSKGKLNTSRGSKGPYALHYSKQRAHTEELRKKTFLPYKQGLLGCLGLSSKSYRALATISKPLQSVS